MLKGKKTAKKKTSRRKRPQLPQEAIERFLDAIDRVGNPALEGEMRGGFCYLYYLGDPLCRLGYRGEQDDWDFAIYRATTGGHSSGVYLLPKHAPLDERIRTASNCYNLM